MDVDSEVMAVPPPPPEPSAPPAAPGEERLTGKKRPLPSGLPQGRGRKKTVKRKSLKRKTRKIRSRR
jgi:hypothetical protein